MRGFLSLLLLTLLLVTESSFAARENWIFAQNAKVKLWYQFETRQAVLQMQIPLKGQKFDFVESGSRFVTQNDLATFYWKMDEKQQAAWENKNVSLFHFFFLSEAQADACVEKPNLAQSTSNFMKDFNWKVAGETVKQCSTEVLVQMFQQFVDQISESIDLINELRTDPAGLMKRLITSFEKLDQTLIEGFKTFFDVITRLAQIGGEAAKVLMCNLMGEFTSTLVVGSIAGPRGLITMAEKVRKFFGRVHQRSELIKAIEANPRIGKSVLYFADHLEKIETRTPIKGTHFRTGSLTPHFEKHSAKLGVHTEAEYLEKAKNFASSSRGLTVRTETSIAKWDPATNEFISVYPNGTIATYFKYSGEGVDPFEALVRKTVSNNGTTSPKNLLPH